MEQITDAEKIIVDRVLLKISRYIQNRKLDIYHSNLTHDATLGFNLACDFLAHELQKIREANEWSKEEGYKTTSSFHKADT